jgi:hypothetical protein
VRTAASVAGLAGEGAFCRRLPLAEAVVPALAVLLGLAVDRPAVCLPGCLLAGAKALDLYAESLSNGRASGP